MCCARKDSSAIAAEIPEKPGTFRVLVGPLPDGDLNKTEARSAERGIPGRQGDQSERFERESWFSIDDSAAPRCRNGCASIARISNPFTI